jgi:hypothetical protein
MPRFRFQALLAAAVLVGCADPFPPLPPPEEILVVANRTDGSLSLIPVGAPTSGTTLALGVADVEAVAALDDRLLALSPSDAVLLVIDLQAPRVTGTIQLPSGSQPTAVAIVDDSLAYVAIPSVGDIVRVNYRTGAQAPLTIGSYPQGLLFTRGRLFVLNGNLTRCGLPPAPCVAGESWISVVDPILNLPASGGDSIALPGPGNAQYAAVAGDGLLYVMNAGSATAEARLSIVDPVRREEVANFGGFGLLPGPIATDGGDRLFVSSPTQGLMEFDVRLRTVVRGEGEGVDIPGIVGVDTDSRGRIYALEPGACTGPSTGAVRVLDEAFVDIRTIPVGRCPVDLVVTRFQREE